MTWPVVENLGDVLSTVREIQSAASGLSLTMSSGPRVDPEDAAAIAQALDQLRKEVEKTRDRVEAATSGLRELRTHVGVDARDAAADHANRTLAEARDTLQYLRDTRAAGARIDQQLALIDDLQKKVDEAERQQRVAIYEFEHSDAYRKQIEAIRRAEAEAEKKQQELEKAEAKRRAEATRARDEEIEAIDTHRRIASETSKEIRGFMLTMAAAQKEIAQTAAAAKEEILGLFESADSSDAEEATHDDVVHIGDELKLATDGGITAAGGNAGKGGGSPKSIVARNFFFDAKAVATEVLKELSGPVDDMKTSLADTSKSGTDAMTRFEEILKGISDAGIFGGGERGGATGKNLLEQLAIFVRKLDSMMKDASKYSPFDLTLVRETVDKLVQQIRIWTGPAGLAFKLEDFRRWLEQQQKKTAGGTTAGGSSSSSSSSSNTSFSSLRSRGAIR